MIDNNYSNVIVSNGVRMTGLEHIPELAIGGIVDNPFIVSELGENPIILKCKISNKAIQRLKRQFQRVLLGSNNKRKRKGLPLYRYTRR